MPDGRQVQKKLGPAGTERGRPPAGYFTKRLADDWLREVLPEAPTALWLAKGQTGASFADAAAECLRYVEVDRQRKPSTVAGYRVLVRSQLLPAFGSLALERAGAAARDPEASEKGVGPAGERGGGGREAGAEAL